MTEYPKRLICRICDLPMSMNVDPGDGRVECECLYNEGWEPVWKEEEKDEPQA